MWLQKMLYKEKKHCRSLKWKCACATATTHVYFNYLIWTIYTTTWSVFCHTNLSMHRNQCIFLPAIGAIAQCRYRCVHFKAVDHRQVAVDTQLARGQCHHQQIIHLHTKGTKDRLFILVQEWRQRVDIFKLQCIRAVYIFICMLKFKRNKRRKASSLGCTVNPQHITKQSIVVLYLCAFQSEHTQFANVFTHHNAF